MGEFRFKMPDIGEGVVEAEITAWHVKVGAEVNEDDPVADAMTDKATIELTAPVSGTITALGCEEGDMIAVGADLVIFATDGEDDTVETEDAAEEAVPDTPAASGSFVFKMPDIGEGVVEAEITAWHISEGQMVNEDDPVADAMTDKATIELTAPVSGKAVRLGCAEGDTIAVGADLVEFAVEGDVASPKPASQKLSAPTPPKPAPKSAKPSPKAATPIANKALASPAVRKRARDAGIDLSKVSASGKLGQVTQADLDVFEKALEPEIGENRIKIIGMRRLIAERMQASKRHIPHFTYVEEIDVTELEALRKRLNAKKGDDKPKLTVLPFIIRALISGLRQWPQMNARYMDEQGFLSQFEPIHLGIATQTDQGLMVPVIRNAQSLSVWDTAREISRLAEGARDATLTKDELTGATTTLTSLGPLGGIVTTPVINRPEVSIFGPNKIRPKLELRDGEVVERQVMNFSISCDHRIIDGYDAAAMMQYMKGLLEDPLFMFLE